MTLADFLNIHSGQEAWLFGKGPSLSKFDFSDAGEIRCAINDLCGIVPGARYCFANDGVGAWADLYQPGQILFQTHRCQNEFDALAANLPCKVVVYPDEPNQGRLLLSRQELAESLAIRRGTLGSAIQILYIMGISTIHLVGIDGGGQHAPGFSFRTRLRNDHARDYNAIRDGAIDAATMLGVRLKFHGNQDPTMSDNGKRFVRITRNTFVAGNPVYQGEILSFSEREAFDLICADAAEPFEVPTTRQTEQSAAQETAAIEAPEAPQPKKRGRKKKE